MGETSGAVKRERGESVSLDKFMTVFCEGQQAGENAGQIGKRFNPPKSAEYVLARASKVRGEGIALPHLHKGGRPKTDPAVAIALLAKLRGMTIEQVTKEGEANKAKVAERAAKKAAAAE